MRSTPGPDHDARLIASVEAYLAAHPHDDDEPDTDPLEPEPAYCPTDEALAALIQTSLADHPDDDQPAAPRRPSRILPPEACLDGVTDPEALAWAARTPGPRLLAAVEDLWDQLSSDLATARAPIPELHTDAPTPDSAVVPDAVLLEAVAACERQLTALTARRDTLAGVFATRRQAEAQQDVEAARAASAADGKGRPWATRARSTGPSEIAARLGIGDRAAETLTERGTAALGAHRDVAAAMSAGALQAAAGSWLLEELEGVRATAYATALERATVQGEAALAALRAADAVAITAGDAPPVPPMSAQEQRDQDRADRQAVDEQAHAAATEHAEQVSAQVRHELLQRATGSDDWTPLEETKDSEPSAEDDPAPDDEPTAPAAPTSRPTAGAGLGATRRTWKKTLTRSVQRADAAAAQVRADKARAAASVQR